MMAERAREPVESLVSRLPPVRGRYLERADLSRFSRFRVGGPAEVLFRPADQNDLQQFITDTPPDIPVTVIGVGSNILIRDGGVAGVVVRLGQGFDDVEVSGTGVRAGAGALDLNVARAAQRNAITGLEFLSGIPGTIGGTLRMNGGAYGREIGDITLAATTLDRDGNLSSLDQTMLDFGYRHCGVAEDRIFVAAELEGAPGAPQEIAARMAEIAANRIDSQPTRGATGGSTFKNPPGQKAWKVIEDAGCRGLRHGGAMVSEKHCNFLVNAQRASASDLETLAEEVRRRVLDKCGIELEWEIRCIGDAEARQ